MREYTAVSSAQHSADTEDVEQAYQRPGCGRPSR